MIFKAKVEQRIAELRAEGDEARANELQSHLKRVLELLGVPVDYNGS